MQKFATFLDKVPTETAIILLLAMALMTDRALKDIDLSFNYTGITIIEGENISMLKWKYFKRMHLKVEEEEGKKNPEMILICYPKHAKMPSTKSV